MSPTFRFKDSDHTFTPFDGPIDQTPLAPLFQEIGHAVMACSRLEYIVTTLVIHINKKAASEALHDPDPVAKFGRMLKLLRKWLTKHPEYAHLASALDDKHYDVLLKEAGLRNEIVHSFLESIDPETGNFTMRRINRVGRDLWSASTNIYNVEIARYLGSQATLATRHFVEVAKVVFEPDPGEQPQTQ